MLVEEVMSRDIISVDSNKTVFEACKIYKEKKVGSLVVMNKNITVGIVTERDTIEKLILLKKDPNKTKIREIMSPNIITVHALSPIDKAAKIMKEKNIKKLPVILNNKIVGIITETDLSRTIDIYSQAVDEFTNFYYDSKETIDKILDDWGDLVIKLKSYKKLNQKNQIDKLEEEIKQ